MNGLLVYLAVALAFGAGTAAAQDVQDVQAPPEDVIVVNGDLPHCKKRPGDPLDRVNVSTLEMGNHVVLADGHGGYRLERDYSQVTGPDVWQRAGTGIDSYVFRVPTDDTPMCIGSAGHGAANSFGQLRVVIPANDLRGKYVRFTAFVAMRPRDFTRAWLAGMEKNRYAMPVGDQESKVMDGTGNWEPLSITMGPVTGTTAKISYGFLLQGKGDLWITQTKLDVFDKRPADTRPRKSN